MNASSFSLESIAESILDTVPMGVIFCDRECIIRFVNQTYASYLGVSKDEALGRTMTELIPDSRAGVVMENGVAEMGEQCCVGQGKAKRTLIVNRIPVCDAAGQVVGMLSQSIFGNPEELKSLSDKIDRLGQKVSLYKTRMNTALSARYTVESILGQSAALRGAKQHLLRYARTEAPVLLLGATGTGKELFANALHQASQRAHGPFVGINCAAIPNDLFESELFGYLPGSFTGATREGRIGKIELAHKGTLFLDEIGDLPLTAQVKLLRVLEDKLVHRLGSHAPTSVDFRLVAATNRDLQAMMQDGLFREELYYRMAGLAIRIPPLRERTEDIPMLVAHQLTCTNTQVSGCSDAAMDALMRYGWPGNVRELAGVIGRAASLCQGKIIELGDLPPEVAAGATRCQPAPAMNHKALLANVQSNNEQRLILAALRENEWNMARTARALGISRATLYEKTRKHGITRA
ncbi:MAG TPA: sigma 54-interacting transcriptional regulator [Humidesulfovibrio sp.]|uniref:sigma-54 interaction domain-containing protein n=1 Tax=Humidesulfovibrio sp. TaxID=2910988 RepID=UPI002C0DB70F|nr:sigma 54-interacting transcriptional regulator [Humidesulfovibrio sp.]HWR02543.1 sigma 54-interacting transcriptional regulator [Humidesulfovibrio sp.]